MDKRLDLSITIISHNHGHFLTPCLASLYKYAQGFTFEVLLIDNKSDDQTVEIIKNNFPEVALIENKKRYSFAKNNNIGIKYSKGRYILLLNPDTTFSDNALKKVIEFMDEHEEVGISACKLLNPDGTIQDSCRKFPTPLAILFRGFRLDRWFKNVQFYQNYLMHNFDHNFLKEIDWALGAFLFVRREVIKKVGMMDEKYPLYYEDIDWCFRVKESGWKIYYLPHVSITHHYLRTSAKSFLNKRKIFHLISIGHFYNKHALTMLKNSIWKRNKENVYKK
ncbi:glycosyltransferase family 2 protein [bacterium]|nr:glycosyltransferase family 2 protein [bacterium]MBU1153800.1 glycosyltransferase family 2 protein [bacterium]MBU2599607.1 glycosyltransferase family 2 protein [bacterium]